MACGIPILVRRRRQHECQHLLIGATCQGGGGANGGRGAKGTAKRGAWSAMMGCYRRELMLGETIICRQIDQSGSWRRRGFCKGSHRYKKLFLNVLIFHVITFHFLYQKIWIFVLCEIEGLL